MINFQKTRIRINIMDIVKILKDYSKTPLENKMNELLSGSLDSTICYEPIKNKDFIIQYMKPINDFIIYTNSLSCCDIKKINY